MSELEVVLQKIEALAAEARRQISQNAAVPNPTTDRSWDLVGLPGKLRELATALSDSGGTAEAYYLAQKIGADPSRIRAKYQKRWGDWFDAWIEQPRRGVWHLRSNAADGHIGHKKGTNKGESLRD
jgi:hypothetical protein